MTKKTNPDAGKPRLVFFGSSLKKALSFVGSAIPTNAIVPVLENVKLYAQDGRVTLTGSDLQLTMWVTIDAECADLSPDGELALMPFRLTSSLVGTIANDPVSVTLDTKTFGHTLSNQSGHYKVSGENPIDFPNGDQKASRTEPVRLTLNGADRESFISGLYHTIYCVATDELWANMTGVNVRISGDQLTLCGTNGHQLSRYSIPLSQELPALNVILPARFVRALIKLHTDRKEGSLNLTFQAASVLANVGEYNMQGRLIDDRYPDFENAIPTSNRLEMIADRAELTEAIKRVMLVSNKTTHQIRLSLEANSLTLSAEDLDFSNEGEEHVAATYEDQPLDIGFNAKMLLSCLDHLEGSRVRLCLSGPNRPGLLFGDNESLTTLVMPVMLNTYA